MTNERDRRDTTRTATRGPVTFTRVGAAAEPPFEQVTSVCVVAVTEDGRLLLADLARGVDLPGGHVQKGEQSVEQTARRETWEETRARLGELRIVEVIESDLFGPDDLTYMVILTGTVTDLAPWQPGADDESSGRVLLSPADFLARYEAGDPESMRHMVEAALAQHGISFGG